MNVTSNCCAATFLKVPFCEKRRAEMNVALDNAGAIWRVPEKQGKRPKTISAGNDARLLLCHPTLLITLLKIAYRDEIEAGTARGKEIQKELDDLSARAAANANVRKDLVQARGSKSKQAGASGAEAKGKKAVDSAGTGGSGSNSGKPSAGIAKSSKKKAPKAVAPVVIRGGKQVKKATTKQYQQARAAADKEDAAAALDAPPESAPDAEPEEDGQGKTPDYSMEAEDDDMDDFAARGGRKGGELE
jgi:hypothetical protein